MQEAEPRRRITAAEARALLPEVESSGLSTAAFARERGLEAWPLYNAIAVARRRDQGRHRAAFAEVSVVSAKGSQGAPASTAPLEIALPSGLTVRVPSTFDEVALLRLLGTLAAC